MLSDETIQKISETLAKRMTKANERVIKQIAETIKSIGTMTQEEASQMVQIFKYGGDYEKMVKELSKATKMTQKDIKKVFQEVAKKDYTFAKKFYDYRNIKYIPWDQNEILQRHTDAIATKVATGVEALVKKNTLGLGIVKKDKVEFKGLKKAYFDIIDDSVLSISQGKETFDTVMYNQIKELGIQGLSVIYKDGYHKRLDVALTTMIMSGVRELHNALQEEIGKTFGADGVEISVHAFPAPDHAQAQGKQLSYSEWEKLQATGTATTWDGIELDMRHDSGFHRPISEYNCLHVKNDIILGVNKPQYTNEQLQQILEKNEEGFEYNGKHYTMYDGKQVQRRIEREVRKQKEFLLTSDTSDNDKGIIKAQKKIKKLKAEYKEWSRISGLSPEWRRMIIPEE